MRVTRLNDTRSYYRRFMDFVFGEKLTDEERAEREAQMRKAHLYILGAGAAATGKVEVIRFNENGEEEVVENYFEPDFNRNNGGER